MSTSELACTYAALILHDDGISVTAEKISSLVNAAGVTVESYWPSLFAKLASNRNIDDLILNLGSSAAPATTAASPLPTASSAANAAPTPVDKKEEVVEESEDDMVFGLFD